MTFSVFVAVRLVHPSGVCVSECSSAVTHGQIPSMKCIKSATPVHATVGCVMQQVVICMAWLITLLLHRGHCEDLTASTTNTLGVFHLI